MSEVLKSMADIALGVIKTLRMQSRNREGSAAIKRESRFERDLGIANDKLEEALLSVEEAYGVEGLAKTLAERSRSQGYLTVGAVIDFVLDDIAEQKAS